jgi:hypothetical protein
MMAKNVYALAALKCLAETARGETRADAPQPPPGSEGEDMVEEGFEAEPSESSIMEAAASALTRLLLRGRDVGGIQGGAGEGAGNGPSEPNEDDAAGATAAAADADIAALFRAIAPTPPLGARANELPPWTRTSFTPFSDAASRGPGGGGRGSSGVSGDDSGAWSTWWSALCFRTMHVLHELMAVARNTAMPCDALQAAEAWAPNVSASLLRRTAEAIGPAGKGSVEQAFEARLRFAPQQASPSSSRAASFLAATTAPRRQLSVLTATFVPGGARTPRLRLHFQGAPTLHFDDAPLLSPASVGVDGASAASRTQWAAAADFGAQREVAVFDFALEEMHGSKGGGAGAVLVRSTTVLPNYRGFFGAMRKAQANMRGAVAEGVVQPSSPFALLLVSIGPAALPFLCAYYYLVLRGARARRLAAPATMRTAADSAKGAAAAGPAEHASEGASDEEDGDGGSDDENGDDGEGDED